MIELHFPMDTTGATVVTLHPRVVYRAEIVGPGTPVFHPLTRRAQPPFIFPTAQGNERTRRFEIHAYAEGAYRVSLPDLRDGDTATLRLYQDVAATRQVGERLDRNFALGIVSAVGFHTGYRLDPTGGADPGGGLDVEACILLEGGSLLGTCIGGGRQSFPDAGFGVSWLFLEERARLWRGRWLKGHRVELGAALRYSQALDAGPRHLSPGLIGFGLYGTRFLTSDGRRRGWALSLAWLHGRLGNAPETERLDTNRFTAGLVWLP